MAHLLRPQHLHDRQHLQLLFPGQFLILLVLLVFLIARQLPPQQVQHLQKL
jgi:hypothetical protein